jgi:cytochrome c-type biogenesis protein CcmH
VNALCVLAMLAAYAGEPAEVEPDLPPPGPPPPADQVDEVTRRIALGLRCPVCQGLSVADSPSETAVMMKNRVQELVEAGYTDEEIRDWFVARYGEWVLLEPSASGLNWLVWLGPGVVGGAGLAWVASVVLRWRREPDPIPLPSDTGLLPKDEYERRLLAEIEK